MDIAAASGKKKSKHEWCDVCDLQNDFQTSKYDAYYDFAVQQNLLKKNYKASHSARDARDSYNVELNKEQEYAANKLKFCHEQLDKQELININVCEGVLSAVIDSSVYE